MRKWKGIESYQDARLITVFSVNLENVVLSTVKFAENNEDALIFGFHDGNVCVVHS